MRILLLHQRWFQKELVKLGCEVVTAGFGKGFDLPIKNVGRPIGELLSEAEAAGKIDALVYYDDSFPLSLVGLEDLDRPMLYYAVDTHHHLSWQKYLACAFDAVWVAQRHHCQVIEQNTSQTKWMPLWSGYFPEGEKERDIEVCFRGNMNPDYHPKRTRFFDKLKTLVPIDACSGDYRKVYPRSKIVVNQLVQNDLNFRVFEAMACGALLVTPGDIAGQDELFTSDKHLVTYKNGDAEDAAKVIKYYLEHPKEREQIAAEGCNTVKTLHNEQARARYLLESLEQLKVSARPRRYSGLAMAFMNSGINARRVSLDLSSLFLKLCVGLFLKSAEVPEPINDEMEGMLLLLKHLLELDGVPEVGLQLLLRTSRSFPENKLLLGGYLDSLCRMGREQEALALLGNQVSDPKAFLGQVQAVVDKSTKCMFKAYCQNG